MKNKIHIGAFNAEAKWKPLSYATLPSIKNDIADNIVDNMEELLFGFTDKGDKLYTRYSFNDALKAYLYSIGFEFESVSFTNASEGAEGTDIIDMTLKDYEVSLKGAYVDMYALTNKHIYKYVDQHLPTYDAVVNVNSKEYSTIYNQYMSAGNHEGCIVKSISALKEVVGKFNKPFIIKEPFGVSGKGSMIITNDKMFKSIELYLGLQEKRGKSICFIVEPYLNKETDFSSHYYIDSNGKISYLTTQVIMNKGALYLGSYEADNRIRRKLEHAKYYDEIETLVHKLYADGYFGYVAIDSMITKDDSVIPVIEINARKSMGLLNYYLGLFLKKRSCKGMFTYLNIGLTNKVDDQSFLEMLRSNDLLYTTTKANGIMPVSMNTVFCNKYKLYDNCFQGRFYFVSVASDVHNQIEQVQVLRKLFQSQDIKLY